MKPRTIACLLAFAVVVFSATGLSGTESRIFALNLSPAAVDIKLGKDGIYSTTSLAPRMASQMVIIKDFTPRQVLNRPTGGAAWVESVQTDGSALYYGIEQGKTYLILIAGDGKSGLYTLAAPEGDKPKIAVANASGQTLTTLQIGVGFNRGTVVTANGLGPAWTGFAEIPVGTYGGFWAFAEMPAGISYFYTAGKDGASLGITPFAVNSWYLMVVWQDEPGISGGMIWDITPQS